MAPERKCSLCGGIGHDRRNCPMRDTNAPNDQTVWCRITNLNSSQATKMQSEIIKAKERIAPTALGSFARGDTKSLPTRILEALGFGGGEGNDKDE